MEHALFGLGSAMPAAVTIGYVEFDLDGINNLYVTTIANQTGAAGCTISYPVCDPLRFLNGTLQLDYTDGTGTLGSVTVPLSDSVDVGADVPPELILELRLVTPLMPLAAAAPSR